MRPAVAAALLMGILGCSDIASDASGVVSLRVILPNPSSLEVGEQLQLEAQALDRTGAVVEAPIRWRSADSTVVVDSITGLVTAMFAGIGRVQALEGALVSQPVVLTVLGGVDSLAVSPDTIVVPTGTTVSSPLVATVLQASSSDPSGYVPVAGRAVIATIVEPAFMDPALRTVEVTGAALADTVVTGASGTPSPPITLSRISGQTAPDTVQVRMQVERSSGIPVPGSGGLITVVFE